MGISALNPSYECLMVRKRTLRYSDRQKVQCVQSPTSFRPRDTVEDEGGGWNRAQRLNGLNVLNSLKPAVPKSPVRHSDLSSTVCRLCRGRHHCSSQLSGLCRDWE